MAPINRTIARKFLTVKLIVVLVIKLFVILIYAEFCIFSVLVTNLRKPTMNMNSNIMNIPPNPLTYQSASVMSSDLDSTSLFETESEITLDRDMTGKRFYFFNYFSYKSEILTHKRTQL